MLRNLNPCRLTVGLGLSLLLAALLLASLGCDVTASSAPSTATPTVSAPTTAATAATSPSPALTVIPSATPASTSPTTVPPATSTPSEVATSEATPASTSKYPVATVFDKIQPDYNGGFMGTVKHNRVGVPLEAAQEVRLAEQSFGSYGNGFCSSLDTLFVWREDTKQIYVLLLRNQGLHMEECRDFWSVFPDTYQAGQPNNDDLKAPEGKVVPRAGFGKVWRENYYGETLMELDFPKAPERYTTGIVQRFENATTLYFADTKAVYVLFDKYIYDTRGGELTGSVWLRAD